jgi:hypothetical protein
MAQSNAQRTDIEETSTPGKRPVAEFRHGGIKLAVWPNQGENGTNYNTTISNSYKDEATGEWKTTTSFSATDLVVVGELASQAFAKITELKQQGRGR